MAVESYRHANATVAGFRQPGPLGGVFLSHRGHGVCEGNLALLTLTGQQTCCCIYRRACWLRKLPALRHGGISDEEAVVLTRIVTRVSIFLSKQEPSSKLRGTKKASGFLPSYPPTTQTKEHPTKWMASLPAQNTFTTTQSAAKTLVIQASKGPITTKQYAKIPRLKEPP